MIALLKPYLEKFETYLTSQKVLRFQKGGEPFSRLLEAMDYGVSGGGKRFRPLLMMASALALKKNPEEIFPAATAIEWIHSYSLMHDDLPSMDNDDFRRGKPSTHKKFGEALGILAGDALLTESVVEFLRLDRNVFGAEEIIRGLELLYKKAGALGMVGGQSLDILAQKNSTNLETLKRIHQAKTGALIEAAVQIPLELYGMPCADLKAYSEEIGTLFQLADDLLDSGPELSYRWFSTEPEMRELLTQKVQKALGFLNKYGSEADPLRELAKCF